MNRTLHTNDVLARVKREVQTINHDGTLAPGREDRAVLRSLDAGQRHHATVLHNLLFGCALVFLIQWLFLGDLGSAVVVAITIPFALFFSIIMLVMTGESANLLSLGAVDFGMIVDSAVIVVENVFRNFQKPLAERQALVERATGARESARRGRMDQSFASDLHQRPTGRSRGAVLDPDHRRSLHSAVHDAGRRGPDLRPHGAHLRLRARRRPDLPPSR